LTVLDLSAPAITDQGLEHLQRLTALTTLDLRGTKMTADGAQKLAAALPRCTIEWNGGTIASRDVARQVAQRVLRAGGEVHVVVGKQQPVVVTAVERLPAEPFFVTAIRFLPPKGAGRAVDDRMLDSFRDLARLGSLRLPKAAITDEGLAQFLSSPASRTLFDLQLRETAIGDASLTSLKALRGLTGLDLAGCPKVTDATLALVSTLPLENVNLSRTPVTNVGLANLKGKQLRSLDLPDCTRFDDRGLVHLKGLTTLSR